MDIFNVRIVGLSPILFHKYTPKTDPARLVQGSDAVNYADEWKESVYLEKDNVVIPSVNIMACIFNGAKGVRKGKHFLTRLVYTSFSVEPFKIEVTVAGKTINLKRIEKEDWIDVTGAKVRGNMVDRARVCLPVGWTLNFTLTNRNEQLTAKDVKALIDNAGEKAGLGDWRPSAPKKPGPYGRFVVEKFDKVK